MWNSEMIYHHLLLICKEKVLLELENDMRLMSGQEVPLDIENELWYDIDIVRMVGERYDGKE